MEDYKECLKYGWRLRVMLISRPIRWPSLRRFLLVVHEDLISLHESKIDFAEDTLSLAEEMVLVLEDRRYFRHYGVDFLSILREASRAIVGRKHGGASTIDMQWVRTVTGYREYTYGRKIYEMFLSIIIQQRYDKITVFKSYMQSAYLGTGIKGIEKASCKVFGKPSADLSFDEAAELASMFVYPRPLVLTSRWLLKLKRRKDYAKVVYPRYEKRFKKLPRREVL